MKFCSKCGKEIMDEAVICVHCGCPVAETKKTSSEVKEYDKANIGLCVLAALIPIFGVIYWPVKYKETPKKATACGVTALVSWLLYFIILMSI